MNLALMKFLKGFSKARFNQTATPCLQQPGFPILIREVAELPHSFFPEPTEFMKDFIHFLFNIPMLFDFHKPTNPLLDSHVQKDILGFLP